MSELLSARHDDSLRLFCGDRPEWGGVDVIIARQQRVFGSRKWEALAASWSPLTDDFGAFPTPPALRLDYALAQRLMDELWKCGLRPKEGTGSAGAMAATERHLADLQKLVDRFVVPREGVK